MSDLSELFARDPVHLSDPDVDAIVARMREAQIKYEFGEKAPRPKAEKTPKAAIDLLKELGLK